MSTAFQAVDRSALPLQSITEADRAVVGSKAAALARLRQAGVLVPDGFVVTTDIEPNEHAAEIVEAARRLGGTLAVRSSAVAEDTAGASYAGQYETELGVEPDGALLEAIERVRASGSTDRVGRYQANLDRPSDASSRVAVLVQRLVPADAAGVAFTADPLTGDRSATIVSAVRGLGERLVSGAAVPDEWEVRAGKGIARRITEGAIDNDLAIRVAELARRVETELGGPQDIEWASVGDLIFLIQARPMTALPESLRWDPGAPGIWTRGIRLGEWLGDPVTPLFESWLLSRIETRFNGTFSRILGIPLTSPEHVVVNGWYFYGWNFLPTTRAGLLRVMLMQILPRFIRRPRLVARAFPPLARLGIALAEREWRDEMQPRYRLRVQAAEAEVESADPDRLVALVADLADGAGDYFVSLACVGGYAAKAQIPLARFYRKHLLGLIGGSHLDLLSGLGDQPPQPAGHAVHTIDWIEPTQGEAGRLPDANVVAARHAVARASRLEAEARGRAALAGDQKLLRRFDGVLREAQHYGPIREEQAAEFTLPWPVLRRAALRLGARLVASGSLDVPEQVFFLTRAELLEALSARPASVHLASLANERRSTWERERRLVPPLIVGTAPAMFARILSDAEDAVRGPRLEVENGAVGIPASPGRATGPARIVRGLDDFDRVQPGDVLVAPLTAPAWTPLFDRVVAVVTDTGGVAAHASIVAREYGLPAVVGTGDATARFHDGEVLEVDGSAGIVRRVT